MMMTDLRCCVWTSVLVIIVLLSSTLNTHVNADDGTIGVCYGTDGNNLPNPTEVVAMFRQYKINKMRIYTPNQAVLSALQEDAKQHGSQDCIHVYVGTAKNDLGPIAGSVDTATTWVRNNIVPYPNVCFDYVTAGNEEVPGSDAGNVAPAIRNLRTALNSLGFSGIGVSTVVHSGVIGASFPPSQGAFSGETINDMRAILRELSSQSQNPKLMINIYPYFAYIGNPRDIQLSYAQFTSTTPVVQDGNLAYYNLFDALVDNFYAAMDREGFRNVGLTITESGWPSGGNGQFTSPDLAKTYNSILKQRIDHGMGTPRRPNDRLLAFIFAMFNENQKPQGVEQNWGLFFPNKSPVYPIF